MSSVVKTITPFIDKEILCAALEKCGCKYQIQGSVILTDRKDYYGLQKFSFQDGRYVFMHDSSAENMRFGPHYPWGNIDLQQYKTVSSFLENVENHYNVLYQKRLEEIELARQQAIAEAERQRLEQERIRMEEERKAFVEKQKKSIIEKAKAKGYSVKETKVNNKIKLVLVRHTY